VGKVGFLYEIFGVDFPERKWGGGMSSVSLLEKISPWGLMGLKFFSFRSSLIIMGNMKSPPGGGVGLPWIREGSMIALPIILWWAE